MPDREIPARAYGSIYTGTILLFTLFDLDLNDVVRVALWLKLSLPGGKNISGSMLFTYMTELELK